MFNIYDIIYNMNNLKKSEINFFNKVSSPSKIQDFLDSIPFNYEKSGETCMSGLSVLKEKKAHCIEGAFFACTALFISNKDPIVVNLKVDNKKDYDHIITIYKENNYYGAISKTNHNVLRWRDPVYKSIRELVMSYFHEYFLTSNGEKTLLGYSKPINLKRFGTKWISSNENLWDIAEKIYDSPFIEIIPKENKKFIRKACKIERESASIKEWK